VEKKPQAVGALVSSGADRIGATVGASPGSGDLARLIDHTLLKPEATEPEIRRLCAEAKKHSFASVCVNPSWVALSSQLLAGTPVKVCTVIGFPLGATTPTAKAVETRDAIANGAAEIDMVINVGALKSGDDDLVCRDIEGVVGAARGSAIVKVILETALLTREEKIKACLLARRAGADFVKTSTGFSSGGATVEDIALMRETVGPAMGVKASGGIRDTATAAAMVAAGATRIGASASVAIVTGQKLVGMGY
jgi:deoxyribose-phosphate aldolase